MVDPNPIAPDVFGGVHENVLQPRVPPGIHLRLRFRDPAGTVRDFPPGYPVRVRFVGSPPVVTEHQVESGGKLSLDAREVAPWRSFTLEFFSSPPAEIPYAVVEAPGSPIADAGLHTPGSLAGAIGSGERFFSFPSQWALRQADWSPPVFAGNGSFSPPEGTINHTLSPPADIGSLAQPVVLVLDPHWKHVRFEYFDRFYGNDSLDSPPRIGLRRRVSIPAIQLEGFYADPRAAGSPPDTHSNWTIPEAQANDLLQCLPWIVRRQADGSALSPPLRGSQVGLRFRTDPARITAVHSRDANTRELLHLSPPTVPPASPLAPLDPGPDRLRYYDLPRVWKSKGYFARGVPNSPPGASPPNGQFFEDLTEADLALSDDRAAPLVFCLDDVVLTDANLRQHSLGTNDRVALFHHRFANRVLSPPGLPVPGLSNEGIYTPGAVVDPEGYPYSDIGLRKPFYVTNYPNWTRLMAAQGNLFDVFADRTPDDPANTAVGARAAVRWVDATTAPDGVAAGSPIALRPPLRTNPFFALQPFYFQRYLHRYENPFAGPGLYDEWSAPNAHNFENARFDIAFLRCCDAQAGDEIAVVLRYHRFTFDFVNPSNSGSANYLLGSPLPAQMDWARKVVVNVANRWNGHDAHNPQRAWIVPSPPAGNLRSHALTLVQYLSAARSHFNIRSGHPDITSSMSSPDGTGQLRVNAVDHDDANVGIDAWGADLSERGLAAAHEAGHCGGMPDEYRPYSRLDRNYDSNHVLGNPYALEGEPRGGLMFSNWYIRARYLWHGAEWLRTLPGLGSMPFIVQHGPNEKNFWLPFYRHAATDPGRSYVNWPIRFNFRQRTLPANSNFDSVLYLLGDDEYSNTVLPNRVANRTLVPRAPGDRIDGILMILVRIKPRFYGMGGASALDDDDKSLIYTELERQFDQKLNDRFCASFRVSTGSNSPPPLRRCLLYFLPCAITTGLPPATTPQHLDLNVYTYPTPNPDGAFTDSAPPNPKSQTLRQDVPLVGLVPLATLYSLADRFFTACCKTLGLVDDSTGVSLGSYVNAVSHRPIVRTVMDVGTPDPVVV